MVAPRVRDVLRGRPRVVGIALECPTCSWFLRTETTADWPLGPVPNLVANPGPLGFVMRCDKCGFRVEMHGDRLPTVAMLAWGGAPC